LRRCVERGSEARPAVVGFGRPAVVRPLLAIRASAPGSVTRAASPSMTTSASRIDTAIEHRGSGAPSDLIGPPEPMSIEAVLATPNGGFARPGFRAWAGRSGRLDAFAVDRSVIGCCRDVVPKLHFGKSNSSAAVLCASNSECRPPQHEAVTTGGSDVPWNYDWVWRLKRFNRLCARVRGLCKTLLEEVKPDCGAER
jgi:hypothetical protein